MFSHFISINKIKLAFEFLFYAKHHVNYIYHSAFDRNHLCGTLSNERHVKPSP